MKCPACGGSNLVATRLAKGGRVFHCGACGWGRERALRGDDESEDPAPPAVVARKTWLELPFYWAISAAIVAGPYFLLEWGIPEFLQRTAGLDAHSQVAENALAALREWYWICAGVYLALSAAFSPTYDPQETGLFGTWIDNPFSNEDEVNRLLALLAFALAPGKLVWFTVAGTFRLFKIAILGR